MPYRHAKLTEESKMKSYVLYVWDKLVFFLLKPVWRIFKILTIVPLFIISVVCTMALWPVAYVFTGRFTGWMPTHDGQRCDLRMAWISKENDGDFRHKCVDHAVAWLPGRFWNLWK